MEMKNNNTPTPATTTTTAATAIDLKLNIRKRMNASQFARKIPTKNGSYMVYECKITDNVSIKREAHTYTRFACMRGKKA